MPKNQTQLNIKTDLSPELHFLIACCQADPSKDPALNADTPVVKTKEECNALIGLAHQHGILPLVYKTLKRLSEEEKIGNPVGLAVPNVYGKSESATNETNPFTHLLSDLKHFYMSIVQKNMLMTSELLRIMKLFEENNIEALAFKGPALAQMAYGDITLRQYGDLDILVPIDKLQDAAAKLIIECGYNLHGSLDLLQVSEWIETTKDMTFMHSQKRTVIEMHWKLFQASFAKSSIDLWEHTTTVPINNMPFTTLNNEVLLAYLSIHGSRHLWERIEWVVDLDRLVRNNRIDWEEVLRVAAKFNGKKMLLLGLHLSELLFHTPLPLFMQKRIEARNITSLAKEIMPLIETPITVEPTTKEVVKRKILHAKMQDTLYGKYIFWKSVLFKPHYASVLEDEKNMSLFFKITKPFRLLKRVIFQQHA